VGPLSLGNCHVKSAPAGCRTAGTLLLSVAERRERGRRAAILGLATGNLREFYVARLLWARRA
jgi:hypothetical protein